EPASKEAVAGARPREVVVVGTVLLVVVALQHRVVVESIGGFPEPEVDDAADGVGVHGRCDRFGHFDAGEHVGGDESQVRRAVFEGGRGKLDAVYEHGIELGLDTADDDLVAILKRNTGEAADGRCRAFVGKLTNTLRRDDVYDRAG